VQAAGDGVEDKDSDFDLPSIAEIRSALAESWFGNGEAAPAGPSTTNGKAAGGEAQQNEEDDEGLLEKLLPFGKDGPLRRKTGLVPTFKAKKPKPLRLKLAEQVGGCTVGKRSSRSAPDFCTRIHRSFRQQKAVTMAAPTTM